ncbi:unnamed protein product [Clonostachys chloroleuca]|uniref:RNase III domain-containing protein n=1 Tax=Clonostachys chloroleuca TaxID=1926264 RepID=A0AA35LR35_9HYPO|nr:unnamed protein product [Clonostachys chloroleuca]
MRVQQVMERIIQRKFRNPKLLEEALIAAGADEEAPMNNKKRQGNKRLALIGDAVLRLTLVDDGILLGKTTGQCETICTAEASNASLFKIEEQHHLAPFIQTCPAQKGHVSPITGATTVEAVVGAVWLDCDRNYAHVMRSSVVLALAKVF